MVCLLRPTAIFFAVIFPSTVTLLAGLHYPIAAEGLLGF
jgi:hypothetical protein